MARTRHSARMSAPSSPRTARTHTRTTRAPQSRSNGRAWHPALFHVDPNSEVTLLAQNLAPEMTEGALKDVFEEYSVSKVTLFFDCLGSFLGKAEVTFGAFRDADRAFHELDEATLDGRPMKLEMLCSRAVYDAYVESAVPSSPVTPSSISPSSTASSPSATLLSPLDDFSLSSPSTTPATSTTSTTTTPATTTSPLLSSTSSSSSSDSIALPLGQSAASAASQVPSSFLVRTSTSPPFGSTVWSSSTRTLSQDLRASLSQTLRQLLSASFPSASSSMTSSVSAARDGDNKEGDALNEENIPGSSSPPHPEDLFSINFLQWPQETTGTAAVEVLAPQVGRRRPSLRALRALHTSLSRRDHRSRSRSTRPKRRARVEKLW